MRSRSGRRRLPHEGRAHIQDEFRLRGDFLDRSVGRALLFLPLLLSARLLCAADPPLTEDYVVTNWQTEQGLPENSATSVIHTPDGYLWFGTFRGLVRFDGHSFTVYDQSRIAALPDAGIVNLYRERSGAIWISTLTGLVRGQDGAWTSFGRADGWTGKYVRRFAEAPDGSLFLATFEHRIFRYQGSRFQELPQPPGRADPTQLHTLGDGGVVAINRDYTNAWTGSGWRSEKLPAEFGIGEPPSWAPARDGRLWAVHAGTLFKLDGSRVASRVRLSQEVSGVWRLTEDPTGLLWGCTIRLGVYRIRQDGGVDRFSTANGLPSDGVRFVYSDQRGNRWIGTDGGGLVRLREKRFRAVGPEQGLPRFPVKAAAPAADGTVYLASYGGGLFTWKDGKVAPLPLPDRSVLYPQTVLSDRAGRLWVGTYATGLYMRQGRAFRQELGPADGWRTVEALTEDAHGAIWAAETSGRTARIAGGPATVFAAPQGARGVPIRAFAQEQGGQMWAAGDAGLLRFDGSGFQIVKDRAGQPLPPLLTLHVLADGGLWLAPATGGLLVWRRGAVTPLDSGRLPPAVVGGILEEHGHVWMATNRGVWRFRERDLLRAGPVEPRTMETQHFDRDDGLPSIECSLDHWPVLQTGPDGRLWFATLKGAAAVDPARLNLRAEPIPAHFEAVTYLSRNGEAHRIPAQGAGEVRIPPGSLDLHIAYAAVDLSNQNKVRFAYSLRHGGEVVASGARSEREISFAQLAPGDYHLSLRVQSSDGYWNAATVELPLVVEPHLWEAVWFRAGLALLMLSGGIALAVYGARRQARLQMRQLASEKQSAEDEARMLHATRMESIGRLAGGVAHDFNNLLTIVNGYSEMLLLRMDAQHPMRHQLESIRAAGFRAAELTRQLLTFSRSDTADYGPLDLNEAIQDNVRLLRRLVGEPVRIDADLQEGAGSINADRTQFAQLLMNLVVNARDAMPQGGAVLIRTRSVRLERPEPELPAAAYIRMTVDDNGAGMDRETMRHVFEPFFTTKPVGEGTGMGLAIVYGVVKRAGGHIGVESQLGRGSRFTVDFPRLEPAPAAGQEAEPMPPGGTETVLLVEDDPAVRRVTQGILAASGYRVIEAGGGPAALRLAAEAGFAMDLLLTDVVMPGLSGYELAAKLREQWPGLRVLFMSGYAGGLAEEPPGGAQVLDKPFTAAALLGAVRQLLDEDR